MHRLLEQLFASIDELNTEKFLGFMTEDAVFRFGSAAPVKGREAIRDTVDAFFSSIDSCSHRISNTLANDGSLACEGDVTYIRHDGSGITLPFANVFDFEGDLIAHYKIYVDAGSLYTE